MPICRPNSRRLTFINHQTIVKASGHIGLNKPGIGLPWLNSSCLTEVCTRRQALGFPVKFHGGLPHVPGRCGPPRVEPRWLGPPRVKPGVRQANSFAIGTQEGSAAPAGHDFWRLHLLSCEPTLAFAQISLHPYWPVSRAAAPQVVSAEGTMLFRSAVLTACCRAC